jgi:hypothetical protein
VEEGIVAVKVSDVEGMDLMRADRKQTEQSPHMGEGLEVPFAMPDAVVFHVTATVSSGGSNRISYSLGL